jgi:hypothetical protein
MAVLFLFLVLVFGYSTYTSGEMCLKMSCGQFTIQNAGSTAKMFLYSCTFGMFTIIFAAALVDTLQEIGCLL